MKWLVLITAVLHVTFRHVFCGVQGNAAPLPRVLPRIGKFQPLHHLYYHLGGNRLGPALVSADAGLEIAVQVHLTKTQRICKDTLKMKCSEKRQLRNRSS